MPVENPKSSISIEGGQGPMRMSAPVLAALKRYWGYDTLRSPQAEVIGCLLQGRDALVVLPTGFGKSLCFQLPAILQTGTTLVISPLIALMEDQVRQLSQRGVRSAALHSQLTTRAKRDVLRRLDGGQLQLLYLSPETVFSPPIYSRIQEQKFPLAAVMVDEAHTVADWGSTFRPDFFRLGALRSLTPTVPMAAFTATANPDTQRILRRVLRLRYPMVVRASPIRRNIHLRVKTAWTPAGRVKQVAQFIKGRSQQSGLVYVRTRKGCLELAEKLRQQGLEAIAYHGGTGYGERRRLEGEWLAGTRQFLVCTNAFGMGIDLPTVRWVVHYQPPPTVVDYVQEVGRGGRDSKRAEALLLVSEPTGLLDDSDRQLAQFFQQQGRELEQKAMGLLPQLPREGLYEEVIAKFGPRSKVSLAQLQRLGYLEWLDPMRFRVHRQSRLSRREIPRIGNAGKLLDRVIRGRGCRWQAIAAALGYGSESACGTCDNCLAARK